MTDKIIIDGIDVSECKYFCEFTSICRNENIGRVVRPQCKNIKNCYYKQLKRKEQECEELRNLFEYPEVRVALTDVRTGEREVWRKLGSKAQKYKQALNEIDNIIQPCCPELYKNCLKCDKYSCSFYKIQEILNRLGEY